MISKIISRTACLENLLPIPIPSPIVQTCTVVFGLARDRICLEPA